MPQDEPQSSKTDADRFDSWLCEAQESDFQEFIVQALQLLPTLSFELLRGCKARVDARLAAEPDRKVFSISDPHQIRLRYWDQIADKLQTEINLRSGKSAKVEDSDRARKGADPEVAKRRSIVRTNSAKSAQELCKLFDFHNVGLLEGWEDDYSVKTWTEAYLKPELRPSVQSLISRDKKAGD